MIKIVLFCDRCGTECVVDIKSRSRSTILEHVEQISAYRIAESEGGKSYLLCTNCKRKLDVVEEEATGERERKLQGFFKSEG